MTAPPAGLKEYKPSFLEQVQFILKRLLVLQTQESFVVFSHLESFILYNYLFIFNIRGT